MLGAQPYDVRGQYVVQEHDVGSDAERGGELTEPHIEAERQRGQDHIVRSIAKVMADALGASDEVSMAKYDSPGLPGAARGVQNSGHIGIDGLSGENVALGSSRPRACRVSPARLGGRILVHEHDVFDRLALLEFLAKESKPLWRCH